ncbi:DUF2500 domain-containing protein [Gorillibacterium timonense]|uniref:DUF2500 domain-containing protein n=1 Tax=Gorillibacterium timonense TaxID=1689269 RepID=UPI00071D7643|nr:DUF2500 domain-containing protein [Gorillibacterium timonense]
MSPGRFGDSGGGFGDFMVTAIPILIGLGFAFFVGFIVFAIVRGVKEWSRNNRMPVLTVRARIVSKRSDVRHSNDSDGSGPMSSSTSTDYYVTYQLDSGERMEFMVRDGEFGLLAEGDTGDLTYQGTRYHGFKRYL